MRKVTERVQRIEERRAYLSRRFRGLSRVRWRRYDLTLERDTVDVMDDTHRIALVETRTKGDDPGPRELARYQLVNHLDSVSLELDQHARIISYQEYTPYGCTSYQAVRDQTETPARYRYAGREAGRREFLLLLPGAILLPVAVQVVEHRPQRESPVRSTSTLTRRRTRSYCAIPTAATRRRPETKGSEAAKKADKKQTLQDEVEQHQGAGEGEEKRRNRSHRDSERWPDSDSRTAQ